MPLHHNLKSFRKNAEGLLGQENPRSLRQSQYTKSKFVYRSACHCSKTVGDPKTVYEVTYEDFYEGTGYKGVAGPYVALGDQLLGVNCRHSFAPWVPGSPRAYSPDPKHPSGLSNDEVYQLTQKQRMRERAIRQTKRELAAAQRVSDAEPTPENQAEVSKLRIRLRTQQTNMRKFIDEANAKGDPKHPVLTRQPRRE